MVYGEMRPLSMILDATLYSTHFQAFVGFLWPVTDLDLDNWTIDFLQYWLTGQQPNLLQECTLFYRGPALNYATVSVVQFVYDVCPSASQLKNTVNAIQNVESIL